MAIDVTNPRMAIDVTNISSPITNISMHMSRTSQKRTSQLICHEDLKKELFDPDVTNIFVKNISIHTLRTSQKNHLNSHVTTVSTNISIHRSRASLSRTSQFIWKLGTQYRVAKTHRMRYLFTSDFSKQPL